MASEAEVSADNLNLTTAAVSEPDSATGLAGSVLRIAPNPMRDRVDIMYDLDQPDYVRCLVYDAAGVRIAELLNAHRNPGRYVLTWDSRSAQPGSYFIRLFCRDRSSTARLLKVN